MRKKTAFVTGISSGLGEGLAEWLLERGWRVLGTSRRPPRENLRDHPFLRHVSLDLLEASAIPSGLERLFESAFSVGDERMEPGLDLVILNAGMLGEIRRISDTPQSEIDRIMQVNVWANKAILDVLIQKGWPVRQVLAISSGASVNGHFGWGAYSLSKAALNMLMQLYAHEMPDSHLLSLAPGLIETAMQDYIYEKVDATSFPSVKRLQEAYGTPAMPKPAEAAELLLSRLEDYRKLPSGSFFDIRNF